MGLRATEISPDKLPQFLDRVLRPSLPYSLPLLRRCQHHAKLGSKTGDAEIWFVTVTDRPDTNLCPQNAELFPSPKDGHHWLAAHIDLSNAGETQVWTFASWEATFSETSDPTSAVRKSHGFPTYRHIFDTMFRHLRQKHIPRLSHHPPEQWERLRASGKTVSLPFSRSKVLFGTLAACHWPFFEDYGAKTGQGGISRQDTGYLKYIIAPEHSLPNAKVCPGDLHFAPIERESLQIILDRTKIPRTVETLRELHNAGLFNEQNVLVAWGLLGKDASISSLHTEPEYRRRGLAEAISKRLMADQVKLFVDSAEGEAADQVVYSHADVSSTNLASRRVMEKLGGKAMWQVAWIELELGEIEPSN